MSLVPLEQLQQDKICVNEFNQTIDFCLQLSESPTSDMKLAILVRSNHFSQFTSMFDWIPALMWCPDCRINLRPLPENTEAV